MLILKWTQKIKGEWKALAQEWGGRERRIPFEISAPDPFYDENNIRYLENKMADYKAGKLKMAEHELIED